VFPPARRVTKHVLRLTVERGGRKRKSTVDFGGGGGKWVLEGGLPEHPRSQRKRKLSERTEGINVKKERKTNTREQKKVTEDARPGHLSFSKSRPPAKMKKKHTAHNSQRMVISSPLNQNTEEK